MKDSEENSENTMVDSVILSPIKFLNIPGYIQDINEDKKEIKINSTNLKQSKWKIIKESNNKITLNLSKGEIKLNNILDELKKFSIEEPSETIEKNSINNSKNWIKRSRESLTKFLSQPKFHYSIIILVIIDLMVVLVDLVLAQLSSPCLTDDEMIEYNTTSQRDTCLLPSTPDLIRGELFLFYFSVFLLILFVTEVFISFYGFGWRHYKNPLYLLDSLIVFASFIMELYFHFGNIGRAGRAAAAIVVLRLWKIVRAIHAVAHSITVKNRLLIKKIQEAQTIIEQEKLTTEKMLEKQQIKVKYLINLLNTNGKLHSLQQIDNHVEKTWQQRNKNDLSKII